MNAPIWIFAMNEARTHRATSRRSSHRHLEESKKYLQDKHSDLRHSCKINAETNAIQAGVTGYAKRGRENLMTIQLSKRVLVYYSYRENRSNNLNYLCPTSGNVVV